VRKRRGRKSTTGTRAPILTVAAPNARWSVDFVHDQLGCGRRLRILNVVEECQELCGSATGPVSLWRSQPGIGEKRSSNMMANWLTAVSHPRTVRDVFSCPRIAR
jgi:hypothetical protein